MTVGITFRLADSVPARLLRAYAQALEAAKESGAVPELHARVRAHVEKYLARGKGCRILGDPQVAAIVEAVLRQGDPEYYQLIAWVVMPNHVHVIIERTMKSTLSGIVGYWKTVSARRINQLLGRRGEKLWFRDYFDREIRSREDALQAAIHYVELNPVKAGLCKDPRDWPFSSARESGSWGSGWKRRGGPAEAGGPGPAGAGGPGPAEAGGPGPAEAGGPGPAEAGGPGPAEAGGPSTTGPWRSGP